MIQSHVLVATILLSPAGPSEQVTTRGDGVGIIKDSRPRMFDRFFRVGPARRTLPVRWARARA